MEDLIYVYTNLRVLIQNVPSTDEAAIEWYMETVVSKDSNFEEYADLLGDYNDVSDFDTPNMSTDNENSQGDLKNRTSYNGNLGESERMGRTSKIGLHAIIAM